MKNIKPLVLLVALFLLTTCRQPKVSTGEQIVVQQSEITPGTPVDYYSWLEIHNENIAHDSGFVNFRTKETTVSIPNRWNLLEWDEQEAQWCNYSHCDRGNSVISISGKLIYFEYGDGGTQLYSIRKVTPLPNENNFTRLEFDVIQIELDGQLLPGAHTIVMASMTEKMADWLGNGSEGTYVQTRYLEQIPKVSEDCTEFDSEYDSL